MTRDDFYKIVNKLDNENRKRLRLERRIEQLNSSIDIKSSIGSEVYSDNNNDVLHSLICEKADLEKELKELNIVIEYQTKDINRVINKVDNEEYRDLLYYKYVKHLNWFDIADILNYTIDHAKGRKFREAKRSLFKTLES